MFAKLNHAKSLAILSICFFTLFAARAQNAAALAKPAATRKLSSHVPAAVAGRIATGRLDSQKRLALAISLPPRNGAELDQLLKDLYDPTSPAFHQFLGTAEFTRRFGATEQDYQAAMAFAESNHLTIENTHPNRLVLDVSGSVSEIEKAFQVSMKTYRHPSEDRDFFSCDAEPTVPASLSILEVSGLHNFAIRKSHLRKTLSNAPAPGALQSHSGSGPANTYGSTYIGRDFRTAYLGSATNLTGAGQSVGLLQFDAYYAADIAAYTNTAGIRPTTVLSNIVINANANIPGSGNGEVSLDIQMLHSMAPGLSTIYVYEATNPTPWVTILSRMANDNLSRQLSCSWGDSTPSTPDTASENIFKQMVTQGQSFFNATGDSDAFVGGIPFPSESTNIVQVGGTTLTTDSSVAYQSETTWNWGITRNSTYNGVGSGGGISLNFNLPTYQQGISMTANQGSATKRNSPDVALTADQVYSVGDNGAFASGVGGTSCAAPLWAGFMALVNQQAVANGSTSPGFINPAIYAIAKSSNYTACFHDVVTGNNAWSNSPSLFKATNGYDLCTGLGSPIGAALINALAPSAPGPPVISSQPQSLSLAYGGIATFSVVASGSIPLAYSWRFNSTPISLATNSTLVISNLTQANAGTYSVVVTNTLGSVTSSNAVLTVSLTPQISQQPASTSLLIGQSLSLSVAANGAPSLFYQWRKGGANILGANATSYSIASVQASDAGNFDAVVTNAYGSITSSVAVVTVSQPAAYTGILAGWDTSALTGGANNFGSTVLAPATNAPNVSVAGLTRASGVGTTGTGAGRGWGGNGFNVTTAASALSGSKYVSFSVASSNGYSLSVSNISQFYYRRSSTGPTSGTLKFQVGTNSYVDVTNFSYSSTASSGSSIGAIDLSGIAALQNVPAGTNVTFLIVSYGGSTSSGTWYIFDTTSSTADDLEITGSLAPITSTNTNTAPVIVTNPVSQTVLIGKNAAFTASASGSGSLQYQWFRGVSALSNNLNISGANTNALSFIPAYASNSGSYSLVVSNSAGSVTSAPAVLSVLALPSLVVSNGASGVALLNATGAVPNSPYIMQLATNMTPPVVWSFLSTNQSDSNGIINFTDTNASQTRFYRILFP